MKKQLLLTAALTVVSVAMLFPHQAFARRCKSISVEEAYERADVVFVGVLAAKNTEEVSGEATVLMQTTLEPVKRKYVYYKTELWFEPIRIWKGNEEQTQAIVYIDASEKELPFMREQNYLIFANLNENKTAIEIRYCSPWVDVGKGSGYAATLMLDQLNDNALSPLSDLNASNVTISKGRGFSKHIMKLMPRN